MLDFKIKKNPETQEIWIETSINGKCLLTTPQLNKGTAFTQEERREFGLEGKLPNHIETLDEQIERALLHYQSLQNPINRNIFLNELHDTNQTVFYGLVKKHLAEMLPFIYTPTVGLAVEMFSKKFQRARGLYISYEERSQIERILDNRSHPDVDLIVVTDGSGVLGIGDQGVGAMMIPVAKLMVYTLCGGINPLRTLPILLDVGTNNPALLEDPLYLGWRHPRITGEAYDDFIDQFVSVVNKKFPKVFLHWEDFERDHARQILDRYQGLLCTFNDDIQGTGVVAVAAIMAALQVTQSRLTDQRIVIFGAGTAGTGIADQMMDIMIAEGATPQEAASCFWLIDRPGLLTGDMKDLTIAQKVYARTDWSHEKRQLIDVVENIHPTILIGCSAVPGAFSQEVIQKMNQFVERPIIFPLSNPTHRAEAKPQDLLEWTDGKAFIAAGSPHQPMQFKGKEVRFALCNNALVFPGVALGLISVGASRLNPSMLRTACYALMKCAPILQDSHAPLLPPIEYAEKVAKVIALAVAKEAIEQGFSDISEYDESLLESKIEALVWNPEYVRLKRVMPGECA